MKRVNYFYLVSIILYPLNWREEKLAQIFGVERFITNRVYLQTIRAYMR